MSEETVVKSVFYDIAEPKEAQDLEQRAYLLMGIQEHIKAHRLDAAGIMAATGLDEQGTDALLEGVITRFELPELVAMAQAFGATIEVTATFPSPQNQQQS